MAISMIKKLILGVLGHLGFTVLKIPELEAERGYNALTIKSNETLQEKISALEDDIVALEADRSKVRSNLVRQIEIYESATAAQDILTSELDFYRDATLTAEKEQSNSRARLSSVTEKLRAELSAKTALENERRKLKKQYGNIVKQLQSEKNEKNAVKAALENLQVRATSLSSALKASRLAKTATEKARRELKGLFEGVSANLVAEQDAKAAAESARHEIQSRLDALAAELEAEQVAKAAAETARHEIQSRLDALVAELNTEREEKEKAAAAQTKIEMELDSLSEDLARLKQNETELYQDLAENRVKHEQALKDLAAAENSAKRFKMLFGNRTNVAANSAQELLSVRNVVLSALPYSACGEIAASLSKATGLKVADGAQRWFPNDFLLEDAFDKNSQVIVDTHLDASPRNLTTLREIDATLVLLISDPRIIVVKRARAIAGEGTDHGYEDRITPGVGERQTDSVGEVVDWLLENFVPHIGKWYADWIAYLSSRPNSPIIEINEHELDEAWVGEVLRSFVPGSDGEALSLPSSHEFVWRDDLSEAQEAKLLLALPTEVKKRYGWTIAENS
ncbi:MAG: hypothetical protein CMM48_16585 [Rhodospirillaceae bacterium]|nr:hypothetical protein [Rhodospirillaceae bacterium]